MIAAVAVALLLAGAPPAELDEARRAFTSGDYASAERLALAAAPDAPDALYLAGLARFRGGRPAEALEALDRAEAGAESAAAWRFNRGACLYELGRNEEAEAAFLEAAADPELAPLALVNAGFAALDGGAPGRARELAARARAAAGGGAALALVEELEEALGPGPGAEDPAPAPAAAAPAPGPPAPAGRTAWSVWGHAGGGWDSDAPRAAVGAVERPGSVVAIDSAFVAAGAGAELTAPLGGATLAAGYGLDQIAYLRTEAEDYAVQQHELVLALRERAGPLELELAPFGAYALTGLSELRGMQASAGVRLAAALAWSEAQTTRAAVSVTGKDGRGDEFAALDGTRIEAAASHEVRLERALLSGGYRLQLERIGDVVTRLPPVPMGSPMCPLGCTAADVEPLAYAGHTGWVGLRLDPHASLRLDLAAGVEWRDFDGEIRTLLTGPGGATSVVARRHRTDLRAFGSETLAVRLSPAVSLTLSHEWLANRTRVVARSSGPGSRAAGTSTWDKQVVAVGIALEW